MRRLVPLFVAAATMSAFASPASAQFNTQLESIAITEFMCSPIGEQDGRDWIELYNFGKEEVDLNKWQITDGANELCNIPEVKIKPGDFVIVVLGYDYRRLSEDRKKIFEAEWLGGKEDPRVVGIDNRFNLQRTGAIILNNRRRAPVWLLGYRADDKPGNSTYLAVDKFDVRHYGTRDMPAINRNGPDGTALGYEDQSSKKEEGAYTGDVSKLEELGGSVYQTKAAGGNTEPGLASPLKGNYPKP